MKVKRVKLAADEDPPRGLSFWCPACNEAHVIRVGVEGSWTWDGNVDAPTIAPSVKCEHYKMSAEGEAMIERGEKVAPGTRYPGADYCCGDCTHALVNQTVPLPDWPEGG